jgi:hypothetical protein
VIDDVDARARKEKNGEGGGRAGFPNIQRLDKCLDGRIGVEVHIPMQPSVEADWIR